MRRLLFTLFLVASGSFANAFSQNLLQNPGFEDGAEPWREDNYMKNEVRFERDPVNPRSGEYAFKMDLIKPIGGSVLQFYYPQLPVQPRQRLRVAFWARGGDESQSMHVLIRRGAAPWTKHFHVECRLTPAWQRYEHTFTLPGSLDGDNTQLMFQTRQPGTIWIDDVEVAPMPERAGGDPPTTNPIRNPSFEIGRDGWTATFRAREFGTLREESGGNSPSPEGVSLATVASSEAVHGRHFLSFDIPPNARCFLTSTYFPARYGYPMQLRFSMRADGPRPFTVSVVSGKNANTRFDGRRPMEASDRWREYTLPVTLEPAPGGVYCVAFDFNEPGRYELDAVSLIEVEHPDVTIDPPGVAIDAADPAPLAHLYRPGDTATFQLRAAGLAGEGSARYAVRVFDDRDRLVANESVVLRLDREGYGDAAFAAPTDRYGAFRIEARPYEQSPDAALDNTAAEQLYSVLPALPDPSERPDSFFGGHFDSTTYNMEIARKAGFRWMRLYPPLITQWMAVEHTPGEWTFRTEGVARARAEGFRILGHFGTTPDFAADLDPVNPRPTRWTRSYPPRDLADWQEYVRRCFEAFGPYVDAWEVWNEPDSDYLLVRSGADKTGVYLALLQATREALGPEIQLIGPTLARINAPFGWEVLDRGAGQYLDAISFHFYELSASADSPDAEFATPVLQRYASYTNRHGQPPELWHTEGGIYLQGSRSWLKTYRIPPSAAASPSEGAAAMVRTALYFKASGVKRYFDYQVGTSAAGRKVHEDITCGFIDVTGIPGPGIAAHAAMVGMVEDLAPAGFDRQDIDGVTVSAARFQGAAGPLVAYWTDSDIELARVVSTSGDSQAFDMMANRLAWNEARLSRYPVYVSGGPNAPATSPNPTR